jgi:hypothetical protein
MCVCVVCTCASLTTRFGPQKRTTNTNPQHHQSKQTQPEYRIRWRGYALSEATWETFESLAAGGSGGLALYTRWLKSAKR